MTAQSFDAVRRVQPFGFDRAVIRLSLAMLRWARRHAERTAISPEEHELMRQARSELQRREHATAMLITRVYRSP